MNVDKERNNLPASIGQRKQPINETLGIYSKWGVALLWSLLFSFVISSVHAVSRDKVRCDIEIMQAVIKLFIRASVWKISILQKREAVSDLCCGKLALSRYGMFNSVSESQQYVTKLAASTNREPEELLTAIFEYYKLLFCFYCLKSSKLILADKGKTIIPAVEMFFSLFWSEESGWKKHKVEKVKFIKAAMMVVEGIENSLSQYHDAHEKMIFVRNLLHKMHVALPQCNLTQQHTPDSCQRCCMVSVFEMVELGVVDKNVWKTSDLQGRSFRVVKLLLVAAVVGTIAWVGLTKVPDQLRKKVKSALEEGMEFVKKSIFIKLKM